MVTQPLRLTQAHLKHPVSLYISTKDHNICSNMSTIKLQSNDGEIFQVDLDIARQSLTVKTMLEDLGIADSEEEETVPLPNVSADILKKIIEWATQHRHDPVPKEGEYEEHRSGTSDIPHYIFKSTNSSYT